MIIIVFGKTCILRLTVCVLMLLGCATTQPSPLDKWEFINRSQTISSGVNGDVRVTVALPTIAEAGAIYGVKLSSQSIQPLWLEVINSGTAPYWFLAPGLDPNHFSPSEAAFAFYIESDEANRQLSNAFSQMQFKNPVQPGMSEAGFVLVNLDEGYKAVDIDLLSHEKVENFSFIFTDPDFRADYKIVDFNNLYADEEIIHIEDDASLRQELEALPCCSTNADGDRNADPVNLVLVGEIRDIVPALVRRNWHATEVMWSKAIFRTIKSFFGGQRYRYAPISSLHLYGRRQDAGWQKARANVIQRNHLRLWLSPIRYRGKQVFIGQVSRDIGVKFTTKSPTLTTHVIDPDVDEARRSFVEAMVYSQAVERIGYVSGVGRSTAAAPRMNLTADPVYTDGLRAVLFFGRRSHTLSEIELLNWESPSALYLHKIKTEDSSPK